LETIIEEVKGPAPRRRSRRIGLLVLAACALSDCSAAVPPLANTRTSPEALAQAVLDAVAQRNRGAAEALALSEQEFRDHVWPELPAARPERNLPFSYVWGDLRQKSEASLTETLARYGGRRLALIAVRFDGELTRYPSYQVHRETTLRVRDASGEESDVRLFGSSFEKDGVWKVFSYVVDD
jgi:hypothetical protein